MRYATAAALRAALDQRLVHQANETGTDVARLRRRVVFERLLVRLTLIEPDRWILKGGAAVEIRLTDRARATRDIDLALRRSDADGDAVRDLLVEALLSDPQKDFFEFRIDRFKAITIEGATGPVWRASMDCQLAGRTFDRVVADLVVSGSELRRVEPMRLPGTLAFAELPAIDILAVDLNQHFAEKLHAMVRQYGDRASTRVKDLVDLVLFLEAGLQPSEDLAQAVREVFTARGTRLPLELPDPPLTWDPRYAELAVELHLAELTVTAAMTSLRTFWSRALTQET